MKDEKEKKERDVEKLRGMADETIDFLKTQGVNCFDAIYIAEELKNKLLKINKNLLINTKLKDS